MGKGAVELARDRLFLEGQHDWAGLIRDRRTVDPNQMLSGARRFQPHTMLRHAALATPDAVHEQQHGAAVVVTPGAPPGLLGRHDLEPVCRDGVRRNLTDAAARGVTPTSLAYERVEQLIYGPS